MLWPLLLCGATSLLVILRLLHTYGDCRRCAWYVQVAAVVSWYLPLTIVFILPFDYSSTLYRKCEHDCDEPMGYIGGEFTRRLWIGLYWFMYMLTWLVLPIMMAYVDSGAFSFKDRLRESCWSNLQFYGYMGAIGLVVVGYIAVTRGVFGADLVAFLMALANFWGLFLVITLMGFGLVSIPRKLWRRGDLGLELTKIENRAMAYKDSAYDSELELAEVVCEAQLVSSRVGATDELRPCVDQILEHCGSHAALDRSPGLTQNNASLAARIPADISLAYLAALHNRVKHAVLKEERDRWRWSRSARRAFFLQDAIASRVNPNRQLESSLRPWSQWSMARRSAAWWWFIALRPLVYRLLTVAAAVLSIVVLWSELTFNLGTSSDVSLVHYLLRTLGLSYFSIEVASIIVIAYMSLCAYSSVMKLRIFNVYSLESHHHTNERSLLFCGAYLCRLMFPLCYNFLNMAGVNEQEEVTEFAKFMDQIDLVPVLGEQSNRAIPVLIMIPAALAFFNVHGRVMEYFSADRAGGSRSLDDPEDDEDTEMGPLCLPREEGRGLLVEARRAAERQQGVVDVPPGGRRYSPSGSMHSNATNPRAHVLAAGAMNEPPAPASTRGPREWHLGRPSFDYLLDDGSAAPDASMSRESPSLLTPSDSTALLLQHQYGNIPSRMSSSNLMASANDGSDGSDTNDHSANGGVLSPSGAVFRPTGMAARFGRWLPASSAQSSSSLSQIAKARSGTRAANRPPNVTARLRPSSRQSSAANRMNYASDDGHVYRPTFKRSLSAESNSALRSPPGPHAAGQSRSRNASNEGYLYASPTRSAAAASRQTTPLVLSPSSPARLPNPWAEPLPPPMLDFKTQSRRHAQSEGSATRGRRAAKGNSSSSNQS
ncbi:hypothetical protein IWW37_002003 [Coemansia sp. RSA 2050]|nr:hypothetical protein IWW37_002003 [Coemansia sp. RSA 2050]KAJ2735484.1 hypothetical protein IW152_001556 [Coemansia sp. BCRC 34962]